MKIQKGVRIYGTWLFYKAIKQYVKGYLKDNYKGSIVFYTLWYFNLHRFRDSDLSQIISYDRLSDK